MDKLEFSLQRKLEIMNSYKLTSSNFDLLQMLFMAQEEEGHPEFLGQWFRLHGVDEFRKSLQELIDKGVILKSYVIPKQGETFMPDDVEFNKVFIKTYYKHSGEMGAELFKLYPSFVNIDGRACSLKNISKYYSSLDDFFFTYGKSIKFNPTRHEEILELTAKAKGLGLLHYGILEFVVSQKWLTLEEEIENGIMNRNTETKFE